MPSSKTLRRASGALILAIVLGMSTGSAIAASGLRLTKSQHPAITASKAK